MHYYPFHIADFALHTNHLSLEEEAVYRRLLDYYYDTESPIPQKTQPVIRRLRLGSWEKTVASVLEEFFVLEDDGWHNLRADIEISDYNSKAETARANGKKGGRPKKSKGPKTQSVILANPDQTHDKANQELEPITNNHKPIENNKITPQHIVDSYNEILGSTLSKVRGLTDSRKRSIKARITDDKKRDSIDWWQMYFAVVRDECPKLTGAMPPRFPGGEPWKADFDFLIKPDTVLKIQEGKYT